jgi:hypothetical protein
VTGTLVCHIHRPAYVRSVRTPYNPSSTADEVIKAQDKHLNDIVSSGDEAHKNALKEMKGRWRHPISGMGWYKNAKRDFAALPED